MNDVPKSKKEKNLAISNRQFEILLKICLILGIVVVSGFIIYFILTPEPGDVLFGILNEDQKAENYPTKANVNETISFYLSVQNGLSSDFKFRFKIKKGNNETILSSSGSNGTLYLTNGNFTLKPNEMKIYGEYNISFADVGENQKIIAELWRINSEIEEFFNILFLRINVTS